MFGRVQPGTPERQPCAEAGMEELFLETEGGMVPIDPVIIRKYNLEKGSRSPFSRGRIVGREGDYPIRTSERSAGKHWLDEQPDHDIAEIDNGVVFETSEILDLVQGVDSDTGDE